MATWESKTKYLANFIRTEAKPHIFYLPKKLNPITECRLEQSKQYVTELIASKRKLVLEDLDDFEQRSKRYWERRLDGRETRRADPMDEDIEAELKEIMKNDDLTGEEDLPADVDADVDVDEVMDFKVTVFTSGNDVNATGEANNNLNHARRNNNNIDENDTIVKDKEEEARLTLDNIEVRCNLNLEPEEKEGSELLSSVRMEEEVDTTSNHNEEENQGGSVHSEAEEQEPVREANDN